ncbi:MAG: hypothetical protein GC168_12105 [Candidatus Hydrogenedens sp.]|nr:hypothetical protein [Candidatus Hydrogenedens sp.]
MLVRQARVLVVLVVGVTMLVVGIPLWISPIPGGAIVVPLGLALLATEFVWARRLLKRVREHAGQLTRAAKGSKAP